MTIMSNSAAASSSRSDVDASKAPQQAAELKSVTAPPPWLPMPSEVFWLFAGLLGMYSLTLYGLFKPGAAGLWSNDEHAHGPIVLMVAIWLLVTRWRAYEPPQGVIPPGRAWSWPIFLAGFALFVVGRALGIIYFEVGSFMPMLIGIVLLVGGWPLLNRLKFPVFFFVFMIPLPGFLVDPLSQFIKLKVSVVVAEILTWAGYPIGRTGVVLSIGQYQLLVADACSGMRTLFMLEALGIFYLNVVQHTSWLRNISLATLIVPISFTANMIRVGFLVLLTYYFGDEVGQGFLHGFAGIVLFVSALLLIISLDGLLRAVSARLSKAKA